MINFFRIEFHNTSLFFSTIFNWDFKINFCSKKSSSDDFLSSDELVRTPSLKSISPCPASCPNDSSDEENSSGEGSSSDDFPSSDELIRTPSLKSISQCPASCPNDSSDEGNSSDEGSSPNDFPPSDDL